METILRSEEMAEIMLLPIRHHSPACSFQIRRVIEDWKPSAILVEGPDNANRLQEMMVHEETKAPFAVYYSYSDREGRLSEEKGHYRCYYPFLEYSPELTALREAGKRGISASFIDLPYGDILAASKRGKGLLKEEEKNNYNDDYLLAKNEYVRRLCEKTGLRSFDEFWEKYFELNGLYEDYETWFSHLLTYCRLARESTPAKVLQEEGCLEREAYMAGKIVQWAAKEKRNWYRILVVTGGFHVPGIKELLSEDQWKQTGLLPAKAADRIPDKDQSVYLMPYSMEAADALNGYASGMPFAGFYQRVWEKSRETQEPYKRAVLDMLVSAGKEVRKKEGFLSTYDEICAWQMAEGLGELRDKPQPGAYELLDSVLAAYVKGEYNIASDMPLRVLKRLMTGKEMGSLCPSADIPPIIQDFEAQCRKFGLKARSTVETEAVLSIFSSKKHRNMSMLFHRMNFLETAFARRIKGPDLQKKKDKNLIREIWKYKWNIQVSSALIDVSVHGATVEEAATSLVLERLKQDMRAGSAAVLLTQVFEMGLEKQLETVYIRVSGLMVQDEDFYSIADALKALLMMEELSSLYQSGLNVGELIGIGVRKLITLLPSMGKIKDENLVACMDTVKLLYQITGRNKGDIFKDREVFYSTLDEMKQDTEIHAGLNGCIHGILYGSGRETVKEAEAACLGYLTGTREQLLQSAVFFRGLFYTAKDLVFIGTGFLEMMDMFLGQVEEEEFMELLPQLRMAFAYFTPAETDKIAKKAAELHGRSREDIMERKEVMPDWYSYGKELDEYAREHMEKH